jgi:hypothetical protein
MIVKFLAGKKVWNAYIEQYAETHVNFSQFLTADNDELIFDHYRFPKKGDRDVKLWADGLQA